MKPYKLIIITLLLSTFLNYSCELTTYAASYETKHSACYDLSVGGTQTFQIQDDNNDIIIVTITEEPSSSRLDNKTYSVSFKSPLAWEAGYKVDINNNLITSVHSAWHEPIMGTILTARLVKESSKQATYYLSYQLLGIVTRPGIRTTISGTSMTVNRIS